MARGLSKHAWQPFTLGGAAAFAYAGFGRLFLVCTFIALLCTASIVHFVHAAWLPVWQEAIPRLPAGAIIRDGYLYWPGPSGKLAGNSFLALAANPHSEALPREPADLQAELTSAGVRIRSSLGYTPIPYPHGWLASLSPDEVGPYWGAWKPAFLLSLSLLSLLFLGLSWTALATLYAPLARLIAFYSDRDLTLAGAWRLACASLMPGALLLSFGLLLYTFREISPFFLGFIFGMHLLLGFGYALLAPFCLRPAPDTPSRNPFGRSTPPAHKANPFA